MIYKITPIRSDKNSTGYIGRTSQSLHKRLANHVCRKKASKEYTVHRAIEKHGRSNFTVDIVENNIPNDMLPEAEKKYVALYNTFHGGYNETEGGEVAPMLCPQIKEKHKNALARPDVKQRFREAGKRRWADPAYVANFKAGTATAYTAEVRAKKSEICKKQRQNAEREVHRGLAKRDTNLRKRAERRAALKTDKERRRFDLDVAKQDRYNSKSGRSMTFQREVYGVCS